MENNDACASHKLSRREFVKATAAFTVAAAILPNLPFKETLFSEVTPEQVESLQTAASQETAYVRGLAFDGNGMGGNLVQVYVKNGKILRITPLDYTSKYTVAQLQPWTINARGKAFNAPLSSLPPPFSIAYKKRAYSPNRVMYPLKRVDWDPSGNRNPQNRGQSKYVRITWDQATTYVANEITRIQKTYGLAAIMTDSGPHGETKLVHADHGAPGTLLNVMGGSTVVTGSPTSWEGWYWGAKHAWGMTVWCGLEAPQTNVVTDTLQNTDLLLYWGADPESHAWGWGGQIVSQLTFWFKEVGIRKIFVSPDFNSTAAIHADKWIPILPNTDIAMHLAIAYTWLAEGTYNKAYLAANTVGFDEASLPSGAPAGSSFRNYVLGLSDGIPKTPKWAEGICGVPSRTIKAVARDWAAHKTSTIHCNGGGMIRGPYSHEPSRTEVLLLAMQGVGNPGINQVKIIEALQESLPAAVFHPSIVTLYAGKLVKSLQMLPENFFLQAITNPPISWYGPSRGPHSPLSDQFQLDTYPTQGNSEVHMFWNDMSCLIACQVPGNDLATAYTNPKFETLVVQHPWFENDCLFADLVLPVKTIFEIEDMGVSSEEGRGEFVTTYYMGQCIDPIGESLSDYEIASAVAAKLGIQNQYTGGQSVEDKIQAAFVASGTAQYIDFNTWKANGYYIFPTDPKWADPTKYPTGISQFAATGKGLETPSGKIEFYSIGLMQHFPNDKERPPLPHYIADGPTHQESLFSPRAKTYPLLLVSDHPKWRVHAEMNDISWLLEIPTNKITGPDGYKYEPLWINTADAGARGIKQGDIVEIFNERGSVLGGAYVTERVMPGAVIQVHGARYDPISPAKIDRGGSNNTIAPGGGTSANAPGQVCSGFLVQVRKADMTGFAAQYPAAFARVYDSATSSDYGSWVDTTPPAGGS